MKHLISRSVALILVLSALFVTSVFASEVPVTPPTVPEPYKGISSVQTGLWIASNGLATCTDMVKVRTNYTASVTWKLQYTEDESVWYTYKTWAASGSDIVSLGKQLYVVSGRTYRLMATIYAYDSDGNMTDLIYKYSSEVSY